MTKTTIFVQTQGRPGVVEIELAAGAAASDFLAALVSAGITVDAETFIFIDESDEPVHGGHHGDLHGLKHGSRVHVCRCRHVQCMVHYLDKTAERQSPPGARVRSVKAWAVHKFELNPKDAAEHVLQVCGSSDRPASDTPLQQLVQGHKCEVCFDLVPEKRVEG